VDETEVPGEKHRPV